MLTLALDVDCVLADTRRHIVDVLGLTVDPTLPGPFEVEDWIPGHAERARAVMKTPHFWYTLPVMDGAQEGYQKFRDRNVDVTIVTAFYYGCPMWFDARLDWLAENFNIDAEHVIFARRKYKVEADRFVDDSLEKVVRWEQAHPNGRAYLFTAPHNALENRIQRVDWETIERIF